MKLLPVHLKRILIVDDGSVVAAAAAVECGAGYAVVAVAVDKIENDFDLQIQHVVAALTRSHLKNWFQGP